MNALGRSRLGDPGSFQRFHHQIEALRLAFADARGAVADPAVCPVAVDELLDPERARRRAAAIDPRRATHRLGASPDRTAGTVYLSVVDGEGNACSFIQSNYEGFGTGIVPRGCGFTLQNRGTGFRLDPEHANALAPSKRPDHTIIPGLTTHADGQLDTCFGIMGGFMQPQGHFQVLAHLCWDGDDPPTALDRPRFCLAPIDAGGAIAVEETTDPTVVGALRAAGHRIRVATG